MALQCEDPLQPFGIRLKSANCGHSEMSTNEGTIQGDSDDVTLVLGVEEKGGRGC